MTHLEVAAVRARRPREFAPCALCQRCIGSRLVVATMPSRATAFHFSVIHCSFLAMTRTLVTNVSVVCGWLLLLHKRYATPISLDTHDVG
jgi:hypothetical protein